MGRLGFVSTAGVVASLLLGAAGCGGEPEPRFAEPSGGASPSASVSASTSPSAEPQALDREETVRAWVEARNAALSNGDLAAAEKLQAHDCKTCADLINPIAEIYENGGQFRTEGWTLSHLRRDGFRVTADVRIASGSTLPSSSAEPNVYKAEDRRLFVVLRKDDSTWKLSKIGFLL